MPHSKDVVEPVCLETILRFGCMVLARKRQCLVSLSLGYVMLRTIL